jgi:hypothetical protein
MAHVGGTEMHLATVGGELLRLGHEVFIYSPVLGPYSDYVSGLGLPVLDRLRELPAECDVVLAQDGIVAYDLYERYPQARKVFRICGDVFDFQSPPQVDGLADLIVVLSDRYERLAEACAVKAPVLRLRTPIDVERLVPVGKPRARPRRAIVLGNYGDRFEVVRETWQRHGVEVTRVGGPEQRYDVAAALGSADIVVAKSRAALDGMACGRAVYVLDTFGGDGWVTADSYPAMEADHFAGQATNRVIDAEALERDLADYDPNMGSVNRDLVIQHHRARDHVIEFLAALSGESASGERSAPLRELARLTTLQWAWEHQARATQAELSSAYERLGLAEQDAERERSMQADELALQAHELALRANEAAALRAELEAIKRSRAWSVARRYFQLRDRLARRHQRHEPAPPSDQA